MSAPAPRPVLSGLRITDPPESWRALGFYVERNTLRLGDVCVELAGTEARPGRIVAWELAGIDPVESIDGLVTEVAPVSRAPRPTQHPNGALGLDHVVITTPDFDRSSTVLAEVGLELRRVREAPGGIRQGFRRLGQTILELVEVRDAPDPAGSARFWGVVVIVQDLDALAQRLGSDLGPPKAAVQPGRRIATLRRSAGLGPAVAFMTPEPE